MIKLVCFDFDGVLVDCVNIHFTALNNALSVVGKQYMIEDYEANIYNGLPTREKLCMLSKYKGLPTDAHNDIFAAKQKQTILLMDKHLVHDAEKVAICEWLRFKNIDIACVSNAIGITIELGLQKIGIYGLIDYIVDNGMPPDFNKPNPQCYLYAFMLARVPAHESLIFEDSACGKIAAGKSGGKLVAVRNPAELTLSFVQEWVDIYS